MTSPLTPIPIEREGSTGASLPALESERFLTLLVEGAALGMPEYEPSSYAKFRTNVSKLGAQIHEQLPDADKLAVIQQIIREFGGHRRIVEDEVRERIAGWRVLVDLLLRTLFKSLVIDESRGEAAQLTARVASLLTGKELQGFRTILADFLRIEPSTDDGKKDKALARRGPDRTSLNLNATGLRGGGAAAKHVETLLERGASGYAVVFRLGSIGVIEKRYGSAAVEDSLMAISAYLTSSLRRDDAIYHWSDSLLIAVLQSSANENDLALVIRRVIENNREITINLDGRWLMLRIPLSFELIPFSQLRSAEDLNKILALKS